MNTRSLNAGATVECNVRGQHFLASFQRREGPWLFVEPFSKAITYRRLRARQILRKVERQESLV